MRLIGFGDLYCEYYFRSDLLKGVMCGNISAHILANLSSTYETKFIGIVGNDDAASLVVSSLNKLNVDTKDIKQINKKNKKLFIHEDLYTEICPCCNRMMTYVDNELKSIQVINNINEDDVLIIDAITEESIEVLTKTTNKAFLCLNHLDDLRYMSLDEIIELMKERFKIIYLNDGVYSYIKSKFTIDSTDLYELLKPDILIISRNKRGADIIFNNEFEKKEIENPVDVVNNSGTSAAYFSEFVKAYLTNETIDQRMISLAHMKASLQMSRVASHVGPVPHILPIIKINKYKNCICEEFTYNL